MCEVKPPIGLRPKWLFEEMYRTERMHEIYKAIDRFKNAEVEIPKEWEDELTVLSVEVWLLQNKRYTK